MKNAITTIGTACLSLGAGTLGVVQPGTVSDFAAVGSMVVAVAVLSRELVKRDKRIDKLTEDVLTLSQKCVECKHLTKCKSCEFVKKSNQEFFEKR